MKKSIFLFALLLVAFSNSLWSADDVYPYIWKNEYKYLVDPTFHTVKFCNDYKNVLCVSDSTIEILNAENGKSLRKKKYDSVNDLVEVSAENNLIAISVKGGYWLNLIDYNTLEIKQSIKMEGRILDFKFFNNNLYISYTADAKSSTLSIIDLLTFQSKENIKSNITLDNFVISSKNNKLYFLHIYITGSGTSQKSFTTLNSLELSTKGFKEMNLYEDFFKNLKLSSQENYLGFSRNYGGKLVVFDIRDINNPKEIKEIDIECFEYCFSYDEKNILFDQNANSVNPKVYLYNIEQLKNTYKINYNFGRGIEVNVNNQFLTYSFTNELNSFIVLRPVDFLSSVNDGTKKSVIEIHNNQVIINFYDNRNFNYHITISDISGIEIRKHNITSDNLKPIDLNYLQRGVYFISISSNNNILETIKFNKE